MNIGLVLFIDKMLNINLVANSLLYVFVIIHALHECKYISNLQYPTMAQLCGCANHRYCRSMGTEMNGYFGVISDIFGNELS